MNAELFDPSDSWLHYSMQAWSRSVCSQTVKATVNLFQYVQSKQNPIQPNKNNSEENKFQLVINLPQCQQTGFQI